MVSDLIIMRLGSLGDVAMTLPLLLNLEEQHPELTIHFLTKKQFFPIFEKLGNVRPIAINPNGGKIRLQDLVIAVQTLRKINAKIVCDLHSVIRTKLITSLLSIIGFKIYSVNKFRDLTSKAILDKPKQLNKLPPVVDRYADVLRNSGFTLDLKPIFLSRVINDKLKKIIGIAPFAKFESKQYDLKKMAEVMVQISSKIDCEFLVFGNGSEEREKSLTHFGKIDNCKIVIDCFSFSEELYLISKLDAMVAMDSGNGHLAANYNIPVITIWGTTHPVLGFGAFKQPFENSIFPDHTIFPNLPVSKFGRLDDEKKCKYVNAINSISTSDIVNLTLKTLNT
jgi:ADP-heptose:LPS heptosyltransferase